MRRLAKIAVGFLIASVGLRLVGLVISRAYEGERTASDEDFKLLALLGGRQLLSEATSLRTGTAVAVLGGIDMDLQGATLDAGGAHIALRAYLGGVRLVVPRGWKVYVDQDARGGGVEVETVDPAGLGDDAPRLTVEAVARGGGILIETEE